MERKTNQKRDKKTLINGRDDRERVGKEEAKRGGGKKERGRDNVERRRDSWRSKRGRKGTDKEVIKRGDGENTKRKEGRKDEKMQQRERIASKRGD